MRIRRGIQALALLSCLSGLAIIAIILYFNFLDSVSSYRPPIVSQPSYLSPQAITGHPLSLQIPSLGINLAVINGYHYTRSGEWTLTLDKAQFATNTMPPNNEEGNTLIYGHYRPEVFAYLHLIHPGSQATVTTQNGYQFKYEYTGTQTFDPRDTSIFAYKGSPRLTLQTCSGTFMQHRQMYYFKYMGYAKSSGTVRLNSHVAQSPRAHLVSPTLGVPTMRNFFVTAHDKYLEQRRKV